MARVTVEDCILKVPNRFDLVMLAAERARRIAGREPLTIDRDNDKDPVVSLREIAEETISIKQMEENLIARYQRHGVSDEPEDEDIEFDSTSEELAAMVSKEVAPPPAKERESDYADDGADGEEIA